MMHNIKLTRRLSAWICILLCLYGVYISAQAQPTKDVQASDSQVASAKGVCPPFKLRDEDGKVIDPIHGINATKPYSPKQTCAADGCHNYEMITEGFHFTQGKGEKVPSLFAERYAWVTTPGNYGGNWCSPAPLYRQLAPKKNTSARLIDMTSFEFVTATCGNCHPGGGPLEYDRDGKRYDHNMLDPKSGLVAGGANHLDGDYFKAAWSKTGVLEADCLLCHMPEYKYKQRNAQLADLNFKWAATQGSGFGAVSGKVKENQTPVVTYDLSKFDKDGNVIVHIAPEPRNETCMNCHAKPDWKKKGASYTPRTDVHINAGLRCVDCHSAGEKAADPRIRGKEVHQFGKGDDPSGNVRNDLDNTVRSCESCHEQGWRNAPKAEHNWLPPLHKEKISCQGCHIPNRAVKSALVQASDVINTAPRISPPAKHIWTFYDQEMAFWNHYGELELFTPADEPTNLSRATLILYKGKIYPANRVHSAWVGYEEKGTPGLNQLFMKDFYGMWKAHMENPAQFPKLATITDDNRDGVLEVNRPEEIDALLESTREYLTKTKFPLEGKRLVWVSDSKAYYSSKESRQIDRLPYEATAYASVHKFSHDIAPAKAAIGARGCIECHGSQSEFFAGKVLVSPFGGPNASPIWQRNAEILNIPSYTVALGTLREGILKPVLYFLIAAAAALFIVQWLKQVSVRNGHLNGRQAAAAEWTSLALIVAGGLLAARSPGLISYMTIDRFTLDAHHFWVGTAILIFGVVRALHHEVGDEKRHRLRNALNRATLWTAALVTACGGLMLLNLSWLNTVTRLAYTGFDLGLVLMCLAVVGGLLVNIGEVPNKATV